MFAMPPMNVSVDDVVDVSGVGHGLVTARDAVGMSRIVRIAAVSGRACIRIRRRHGELVFVDVVTVDVVQMAVVHVVDVIVVANPEVAALRAVLVTVLMVDAVFQARDSPVKSRQR